jgi:integrase
MPLSPRQVADAIKSGVNQKIADGHNLYLVVKNRKGFWVHQFRDGKVIRSKGLGSAATVTPAQARREREAFTVARREGLELPGFRFHKPRGNTFAVAADEYLSNHASEWGERHRAALKALVWRHAAALADVPVNRLATDQIADALRPIWNGPGNNRGSRLRRLIESVLTAKDVEPNPATWARLREKLSKAIATVTPKPSMPAADVPTFYASLGDDVESRALKFVILTAVRRKEALGARWSEFDLEKRVWVVPAERMKMKRNHTVPLTDAMIACLGPRGADDALVFPSKRTDRMLGHDALSMQERGYTLHGFRATASTWAEEQGDGRAFARSVIKAMLAHGKGDAVTAAYLRSDLFDARRELMEAWSRFATGGNSVRASATILRPAARSHLPPADSAKRSDHTAPTRRRGGQDRRGLVTMRRVGHQS